MRRCFVFILAGLCACTATTYTVVRQGALNPLQEGRRLAVADAIDFDHVLLETGSEADYLKRNSDRAALSSYAADKLQLDRNYRGVLRERASRYLGDGPDRLFVEAVRLVPGDDWEEKVPGGAHVGTRGVFRLTIRTQDGTIIDEALVEIALPANERDAEVRLRMRMLGTRLGEIVSDYLAQRAAEPDR